LPPHAGSVTARDVERCIKDATSDQERVLYCVLAGSGLRIAEALAIHVSRTEDQTSWNPESQAIDVRSSISNGQEICRLKTAAARRTVDLHPGLSDLIAQYGEINGIRPGDYLFQSRSGRPAHLKTVRERLAKHGIPGFHSFRRHRITRLRELGVPEDIVRYWVGHEGQSITDRYSKLGENVEIRRDWAKKAGLGFALSKLGSPNREIKSITTPTPAESAALAEEIVRYQATDEDLPAELFEISAEPVASRVSAKPAMRGHFKTGHSRPGTLDVVPIAALSCKSHF